MVSLLSMCFVQRSEAGDRLEVARRLREHVMDPDKLPILIFPEGTCINNTSVMQFKKGSFEVGCTAQCTVHTPHCNIVSICILFQTNCAGWGCCLSRGNQIQFQVWRRVLEQVALTSL